MKKKIVSGVMLFGLLCAPAHAAVVNVGESWSSTNTAGWVARDLINEVPVSGAMTISNGALKVTFPSYLPFTTHGTTIIPMPMPPERYLIKAGTGASGGHFSGNYLSNGVEDVSFRIYCDYPVEVSLVFQNESSGRWWQFYLGAQQTGLWKMVTVPIQPTLFRELIGAKDWASFQQDFQNVSWIGIVVQRYCDLNPQTVMVDDFVLTGPGADFASWMAQYASQGAMDNVNNSLPDADLDGDGQNNTAEWIAGTSAADSNDCLRVMIEQNGQSAPRLKWKAKPGRVYNVWRCTNLAEGFSKVGGDLAPASDEATYEETNSAGAVFFRIDARMAP
ncbi:MAG: hypothetical protein WCO42_01115 [bacterium]